MNCTYVQPMYSHTFPARPHTWLTQTFIDWPSCESTLIHVILLSSILIRQRYRTRLIRSDHLHLRLSILHFSTSIFFNRCLWNGVVFSLINRLQLDFRFSIFNLNGKLAQKLLRVSKFWSFFDFLFELLMSAALISIFLFTRWQLSLIDNLYFNTNHH